MVSNKDSGPSSVAFRYLEETDSGIRLIPIFPLNDLPTLFMTTNDLLPLIILELQVLTRSKIKRGINKKS
jgi:hypothetical protein